MVYLYGLIVATSALVFGVFCRAVLLGLGFVPDFGSGLTLVLGAGSLYVLVQAGFMGCMRLYQPTRAVSTYLTEIASNAGVLALVPFIMHVRVEWPVEQLARVEPLIFFGVCVVIQLVFKLATFFGSHRGDLVGRLGVLGYVVTGLFAGFTAIVCADRWVGSLDAARVPAPAETSVQTFGDEHAEVRVMPEGATLTELVETEPGLTLTTRWSVPETNAPEVVYTTFVMNGKSTKVFQDSIEVRPGTLAEIRVPTEYMPEDVQRYSVRWTRVREPNWQRMLGLRPIVYALPESPDAAVPPPLSALMSGPFVHRERPMASGMNVVLIVIDGLASGHVSMNGYPREVTPALDRLGFSGLLYPNGESFTADSAVAAESMLSGRGEMSLRANTSGEKIASVLAEAGYATVAYTEGTRKGDGLRYGNGFEAGFELFADGYDATEGSQGTAQRAQEWIRAHQEVQFFVFLRLTGLTEYRSFNAGEGAAYPEGGGRPTEKDSYDNALASIDASLGSLLKFIRDYDTRKNTFVIVTSPYGYQFSLDNSGRQLDEPSMRVPVIINGPGVRQAKISTRAELKDIGATIAAVTQTSYTRSVDGKPLN